MTNFPIADNNTAGVIIGRNTENMLLNPEMYE